jgi:hypothetical protein
VSGRRCVSPAKRRRVAIIRCRTVQWSRANIAWRATTIHCWRGARGVSQHHLARGRMVRNDRPSCLRYGSAAAARGDRTCVSTARTSQHVTTSVISARRVEASTAGHAITCRSCRSGRNRHRQVAGRGGYGRTLRDGPTEACQSSCEAAQFMMAPRPGWVVSGPQSRPKSPPSHEARSAEDDHDQDHALDDPKLCTSRPTCRTRS